MRRHLIILIALLTMTPALMAQETIRLTDEKQGSDNQISVKNLQVARTQEKTIVTMDFVLDQLQVPSNRYRAFTPVIKSKDGTQQQRLKTLIVSGRRQNIVFERDGIDPLYADNCDNVRRQNGEAQTYNYTDAVKTEAWFRQADLTVECDLCGCGDVMKNEQTFLASLLPPDPYDLIALTDLVPVHVKKDRNLHGSAYVTFVVDKWDMKPDYMDNRRELRKITDTLDVMAADANVSVRQVKIHGFASPESPYEHNRMLANNRAKSLTDYVKSKGIIIELHSCGKNDLVVPAYIESGFETWNGMYMNDKRNLFELYGDKFVFAVDPPAVADDMNASDEELYAGAKEFCEFYIRDGKCRTVGNMMRKNPKFVAYVYQISRIMLNP